MKYRRNDRVVAVSIGCDKALLNVQTGKYLYLNETAARIWDLLETERSADTLADLLCSEYEIDLGAALAKIQLFLQKAEETGVLRECHGETEC